MKERRSGGEKWIYKKGENPEGERLWEPSREFGRADFPSSSDRTRSSDSGKKRNAPGGSAGSPPDTGRGRAPVRKGEKPPSTSSGRENSSTAAPRQPGGPALWNPPRVERGVSPVIPARKKEVDAVPDADREPASHLQPFRPLMVAILSNRENSLHLLRRWYWEKPGSAHPPEGERELRQVPPHDRIHVILASLTPRLQEHLFATLSPMERRQFNDILKRPLPALRQGTVDLVRHWFMSAVD